jgi:hypothetical protein
MKRINFIFGGREYAAHFTDDGEVFMIYDYSESRFLDEDKETNERERPNVWVAAYTMAEA